MVACCVMCTFSPKARLRQNTDVYRGLGLVQPRRALTDSIRNPMRRYWGLADKQGDSVIIRKSILVFCLGVVAIPVLHAANKEQKRLEDSGVVMQEIMN